MSLGGSWGPGCALPDFVCTDPDKREYNAFRMKPGSPEATVRVGGAAAILTLVEDFGVDPLLVLREAGIDPKLFEDPDNLITYQARGRLMSRAVSRSGCQHFGLLVGERMQLQSLGLVGLIARNAPDVGTALGTIVNFLHLHARGAVMKLSTDKRHAHLTYDAHQDRTVAADQIGDAAVAMMLNVMRTICGPDFRPLEASFAHREPENVMPYGSSSVFRCASTPSTIPCRSRESGSNSPCRERMPKRPDCSRKQVESIDTRHGEELPEVVRGVLRTALTSGLTSADKISAMLSMQVRTLERRLEEAGTSFHDLLEGVRFEVSCQLLKDSSLAIGEIAGILGYGGPKFLYAGVPALERHDACPLEAKPASCGLGQGAVVSHPRFRGSRMRRPVADLAAGKPRLV